MDPLGGCRDPGEGGKVLGVFLPHFLHHTKGIKKYTLTSLNTCIIPVVNSTYHVDQLIGMVLFPAFTHLARPQDYVHSQLGAFSTKVEIDVQEEVTYPNKFGPRGVQKLKCSDK